MTGAPEFPAFSQKSLLGWRVQLERVVRALCACGAVARSHPAGWILTPQVFLIVSVEIIV